MLISFCSIRSTRHESDLSALAIEVIVFSGAVVAQPNAPIPSGAPHLMYHLTGDGGVVCMGTVPIEPKPTLPIETTKFVCRWGAQQPNQHFVIKNGSLVMTQTGDVWTILQNNEIGIVVTSSMANSFSGKILMRDSASFLSIAIERTTGGAVKGVGPRL
jgi:hypothetical protein